MTQYSPLAFVPGLPPTDGIDGGPGYVQTTGEVLSSGDSNTISNSPGPFGSALYNPNQIGLNRQASFYTNRSQPALLRSAGNNPLARGTLDGMQSGAPNITGPSSTPPPQIKMTILNQLFAPTNLKILDVNLPLQNWLVATLVILGAFTLYKRLGV